MHLNPCMFVFFRDSDVFLWDYKKHQQFAINKEYFDRLVEFSKNPVFQPDNSIDKDFLEAGVFVENIIHSDLPTTWGWDMLSHIFHVGTKDIPLQHDIDNFGKYIETYVEFCEKNQQKLATLYTEKEGELFLLPEPDLSSLSKKAFATILKERMTSRCFDASSISLDEVSNLLYATFGHIHGDWKELELLGLEAQAIRKSSPSGGGLHPSEAYVLANNIDGLPKGIYHYRSHQHVLTLVSSDWEVAQLGRLLAGQHFAKNLPLGIFISCRFDKLWDKYTHSRAYRVALMDVGHLSQTFQLCATAMELECWLTGVFLDTDVNNLLHLSSQDEQVMFFVGAGRGTRKFLDSETLKFLKQEI